MINTDFVKPVPAKQTAGGLEQGQALLRGRQRVGRDHRLAPCHPRHMCITIERDPVGVEREQFFDALRQAGGRLMWQAKQDIRVEAPDVARADHLDHIAGDLKALSPTDHLLDFGIEVLNTDGRAVQSRLGQRIQTRCVDLVGIDFNGKFAVCGHRCHIEDRASEIRYHSGLKQRRCATAPMQARQPDSMWQMLCQQAQFVLQRLQICRNGANALRALRTAGAEPAKPAAEGDVDVE